MTNADAQARAAELNRELPDGADHHWIAHHTGGENWRVARVSVRGMRFAGEERHTTTESRPQPEAPTDTRPFITRLIPPFGPN
jgi:hypothetical protein